jgi:hypothetical protein
MDETVTLHRVDLARRIRATRGASGGRFIDESTAGDPDRR